ncbi:MULTISPECIES: 30S ribosomal protein S16 [Rosistilla]|uniref:Small ribosomal subunit protein bS16 n=2 Tax=Rosistilla TaxID=2795779 RepID=A0A518IP61_9BACT|nr:30S ribosomal protein S16 [Rosistilla ulvae]QDS86718.1 30S ribosomal protein S16 [Rosistilla ulvae]QDV54870.1 30S ribosomal protein S16 [Rosistilla oblonga]
MAVRIRMKKMGRAHRPFYRLCAVDQRNPRDGKVIEELGYYDTSVPETDARAILKGERINYWLGVGAQASDKCQILIKKYGAEGTHLEKQREALQRMQAGRPVPAPKPAKPKAEAEAPAAEAAPAEAASE